jgi:two-component system vancomycin resistance associated response regulator VraR
MDKKIRVIVAEDIDVLREHFAALIDSEPDMQVVAQASSGRQACECALRLKPDVVLMDIEMDMKHDGIMAARRILEQDPKIRVVFLTVHEDDETVFGAFETGAVDYVLKSSAGGEIVASIRSAVAGTSPIRPEIASKIRNEFTRIRKNQANLLEAMSILTQLTPTELEIIDLLLQNVKVADIARIRQVEMSTVKSQINAILKKFNKKRTKDIVKLIRELDAVQLFQTAKRGG